MTTEAEHFAAIARCGDEPEPYRAYAAWLDAEQDPRGELVRLQLARETARGADAAALARQERAWLITHRDRLFGPFAPLVVDAQTAWTQIFGWRRGFLTSIDALAIPTPITPRDGDPPDTTARLPRAEIARGLAHPAARHVAALRCDLTPRRVPPGVASVHLRCATLTERLLTASALRWLVIDQCLGGVPLVHAGLETLELRADDLGVDLLERCALPSLKRLVCREIDPAPALVARLAAAIAALGVPRVELLFMAHPTTVSPRVGPEAVAALGPIADRIVALALPVRGDEAGNDWDLELPRLERIDLAGRPSAGILAATALRNVEELSIQPTIDWGDFTAIDAVCASGLAPRLRRLRLYVDPRDEKDPDAVRRLAAQPFHRLEELALALAPYGRPQSDLFGGVGAEAFPALESVRMPRYDVGSLARSPLAGRVRRLTLDDRDLGDLEGSFPHAEIVPELDRPNPFWTHLASMELRWTSPPPLPQFGPAGSSVEPPDLTAFPRLANIWAWARHFRRVIGDLLPARLSAPPATFDAFARFAASLGVDLDFAGYRALDQEARLACIEAWRRRLGEAVAAREGEAFAPLFSLGVAAEGALHVIHEHGLGDDPGNASRFLAESASLAEPLRAELAEVRGWCEVIAARRVPPHTFEANWFRARGWAALAFAAPFAERDAAYVAPAPPAKPKTTFETATRDHVVRQVARHWLTTLLEASGDAKFAGDLDRGSYTWSNGADADAALAWSPQGVVAVASAIYGDGDNTRVEVGEALGKPPRAIPGVAALQAIEVWDAMSALWIAPRKRHRYVAGEGGFGAGDGELAPFVTDAGFACSAEVDGLTAALADLAIAGGGALTVDQGAPLDTWPDGSPRSDAARATIAAALKALRLKRPKPKKKR